MVNEIPESHLDLVEKPHHGVLTTIMPNGQPQSSIVWCDYDGDKILINTTKERQKGKNLLKNSKISLLIIDPKDLDRFLSIRGDVEIIEKGALDHLDQVTRKFTKYDHYYGNIYPLEQKNKETRIICKINPKKIILDAIHK